MNQTLLIKQQQYISVVIPVFNEQDYLGACLDAIARQTRLPDVVYVVDNNSTDYSIAIARTYSFVTILHEPKQGICAATKRGLDKAANSGGIILRLDADCQPRPDWIQNIAKVLSADISTVAVTGPGVAYDASRLVKVFMNLFYMQPYFFACWLSAWAKTVVWIELCNMSK